MTILPTYDYDHGLTKLTFTAPGDFEAFTAAERWLGERGFSCGRRQGPDPRGVLFGNWCIHKWRGLNDAERSVLHGIMTGDGRNGPVVITIFATAPAEARKAILGEPAPAMLPDRSTLERVAGRIHDVSAFAVLFLVATLGLALWLVPQPQPQPQPRAPAPKFSLRVDPFAVTVMPRTVPTLVSEPGR